MLRRSVSRFPKALTPYVRGYRTWYDPRLPLPLLPRYRESLFRFPEVFQTPFEREFDVDWFGKQSMNDYFQTLEEKDKYVVNIKDEHLSDKNVTIDFNKNDNSLNVSIEQKMDQEDKGNSSSFSSSFSSNYQFEKPVNVDGILANHGKDGLTIIVPKLEPDKPDDLVNIKINKIEGDTQTTENEKSESEKSESK